MATATMTEKSTKCPTAAELNRALESGGMVQVATPLRSTLYKQKHAGMFVERDGSLYVQRGKHLDKLSMGDHPLVAIRVVSSERELRPATVVEHPSGTGFAVNVGKQGTNTRWISGGAGPFGGGDIGRWPTKEAATNEAERLGYEVVAVPHPKTPKAEAPKPTPEAKVKGITYYRGVSRHEGMEAPTGERRRPSVYFTRSEREARFYGKDIEKVTVDPKNPMYSETAVDAAEKLGVIKDYDKYIGSDPIKADEVIYNAAKKAGYDAIIRRDGDWVQVIDKGIISPTQPPGMQVGHQSGSLGVPPKVHSQKSTGKAVTASMESFAKLQEARKEAAPVIKKAEQAKDVLGTLSYEDASELLAGLDLRVNDLDRRIDEGKANLESIKESLDPRIAKLTPLIPTTKEGRSEITHITKGQYRKVWGKEPPASIVSGGKVRWEYALDTIAQELHLEGKAQTEGKHPEEYLKGLIEDAKDTKELIRATEAEIHSDESTLKALDKLKDTIKARTAKTTAGPLLQKLAKAPKVKATTKPKPETKAKAIVAGVAQALIQRIQAKRGARAVAIDRSLLAVKVVPVSKAELWAKNPNRMDIRGVDTPGSGRVVSRTGFADRGKTRMSRKHHRGWKRIKL